MGPLMPAPICNPDEILYQMGPGSCSH